MLANPGHFPKLTTTEYLAWEEKQLERHEYLHGEVYAISGAPKTTVGWLSNSRLCSTIIFPVATAFNSDCKANLFGTSDSTDPDASVSCDPRDRATPQYITYPCLIVEVRSESTEAYVRGNKFFRDRQNPHLQDYVLPVPKKSPSIFIPKERMGAGRSYLIELVIRWS